MARKKKENVVAMVDKSATVLKYLNNLCKDGGAYSLHLYLSGEDPFNAHNLEDFSKSFRTQVASDHIDTARDILGDA